MLEEQIFKKKVTTKWAAGVAIAVNNRLINYIDKIHPINDRIIIIEFSFTIPLIIIKVYAPTAEAEEYIKTGFYNMLSHHTSRFIKKGIVQIMGDFNARIQAKADDSEQAIGPHTFQKKRCQTTWTVPRGSRQQAEIFSILPRTWTKNHEHFFPKARPPISHICGTWLQRATIR